MLGNGPAYPPSPGNRTRSVSWSRLKFESRGAQMSPMLILWIVWAGVLAILLILLAYRGTLTRYEEDQLFLDDAGNHQKQEQTEIVTKVNKIQPWVRIATGATCVLSACILGIYIWDAVRHIMM